MPQTSLGLFRHRSLGTNFRAYDWIGLCRAQRVLEFLCNTLVPLSTFSECTHSKAMSNSNMANMTGRKWASWTPFWVYRTFSCFPITCKRWLALIYSISAEHYLLSKENHKMPTLTVVYWLPIHHSFPLIPNTLFPSLIFVLTTSHITFFSYASCLPSPRVWLYVPRNFI